MLDEGRAIGEDGVVDGMPVASRVFGDLVDGATVLGDLEGRPTSGTIGHLESWCGDALVDLGPGARRAVDLLALEPSLVPHERDLTSGHREVDEGH